MIKKSIDTSVGGWLRGATAELEAAGIESARLDAEILLAHTLRKSRTWLHAHGEEKLDRHALDVAQARLDLRLERVPIAYIIGHKEFYGRLFKVTPAVLIPRPESEDMITLLKESAPAELPLVKETMRLVDVGTGSGALGITAKLELPYVEVTLLDISRHALAVAEANAAALKADAATAKSDLLQNYPFRAHVILANLPYVDEAWERSPETNHEPTEALFAAERGLKLINKLLPQAADTLAPGGQLYVEADRRQHAEITARAAAHGLPRTARRGLILQFTKVPA